MLNMAQTQQEVEHQLELENKQLEKLNSQYSSQLQNYESIEQQIKDNTNAQELLNNKVGKLNEQLGKPNFSKIETDLKSVGKSVDSNIKKVGKWVLAIFGIRSACNAVRGAINLVSQYNKQISTDFDYMKFAISKAFEPLVTWVVSVLYKVLGLVNAIVKAMFNFDLFSKASVGNYKKMSKSSSEIAKNNNKSLSAMDEITNLNNDTSGSGSGGTTDVTPTVDLSKANTSVDKIVKDFKKAADEITSFWEKDWERFFLNQGGNWGTFIAGIGITLKGFYDVFKGIFDSIGGLFDILVGVFTGDIDKIRDGWNKLCNGLANILLGALEIISGIVLTIAGAILGILLDLANGIYKVVIIPIVNFFKSGFDLVLSAIKLWLSCVRGVISALVGILTTPIRTFGSTVTSVINNAKSAFNNLVSGIKKLFNGDLKGALNNFKSTFKSVFNSLVSIAKAPLNLIINAINSLIKGANKIKFDVPKWVPGLGGKKFGFNIPTIPKLERGGIVNNPGPGVYMGNYVAGEKGAEAIVPLQNSPFIEDFAKQISENMNNEMIINLLLDLNRNILELANKPTILCVDGKECAQALYKPLENERNRMNVSTSISIK